MKGMIQINREVSADTARLLMIDKLRAQRERIQAELDRLDRELQEQIKKIQADDDQERQ